jgi:phosphate:Na+ symporter
VTIKLNTRHELTLDLLNKTKLFISEATSLNKNDTNTESLFSIQSRNEDMISLVNGLYSFVQNIEATHNFQKGLASSMVESLHLILTLLNDSLISNDNGDELLLSLTSDRSDLMEKIRDSLLNDQSINLEERQILFVSTSIFERIIWLIRRIHATRLVA